LPSRQLENAGSAASPNTGDNFAAIKER